MAVLNPEEDGITHIDIYSKGKTNLGQFLSNFTFIDLITEDGYFSSVEAYWYWLLAQDHPRKDCLRYTFGFNAKVIGRTLSKNDWDNSKEFQEKIKKVLLIKVNHVYDMFCGNNLPFEHYYVYGGKAVKPKEGQWIIDYFNELRIANSQSK